MTFKELLREKDIHGAQLARKIGCSRASISAWTLGKSTPRLEYCRLIATALGISVNEVVNCFVKDENSVKK